MAPEKRKRAPAVILTTVKRRAEPSEARSSSSGFQARLKKASTAKGKGAGRTQELSPRAQQVLDTPDIEEQVKARYGPQPRLRTISSRSTIYEIDESASQETPRLRPLTLSALCIRVAATRFRTHILPCGLDQPISGEEELADKRRNGPNGAGFILDKARGPTRKATEPISRKRRRPQHGLFSYDESRDRDYRESKQDDSPKSSNRGRRAKMNREDEEEADGLLLTAHDRRQRQWGSRPTLQFWHLRNSQLLREYLPAKAYPVLRQALVEVNPTCLTQHVIATYFVLGREDVSLSSSIDTVSNSPLWPATLLSLILAPGSSGSGADSASGISTPIDDELPLSIAAVAPQQALHSLRLEGLTRLSTGTVLQFFHRYRAAEHLTTISLAGCIGVGAAAMKLLASTCASTLTSINLNHTDVGPEGLEELFSKCGSRLEELECCDVQRLNDETIPALLSRCIEQGVRAAPPTIPCAKLRKLWLRNTEIGDVGISSLLKLCSGSLESLNLENTQVAARGNWTFLGMALRLPGFDGDAGSNAACRLKEINLSRLLCWLPHLEQFLRALCTSEEGQTPCQLRTIVLENMRMTLSAPDASRTPATEHGLSSQPLDTMREALLSTLAARRKTQAARRAGPPTYEPLMDYISLASNARLGSRSGAVGAVNAWDGAVLRRFVRDVGRFCRRLNLNGIHVSPLDLPLDGGAGTADLSPALQAAEDEEEVFDKESAAAAPCTVQELELDGDVHEDVLEEVQRGCRTLRYLNIAGSQATVELVDGIIENNPCLEQVDLTLCRGIPRSERREYFSVRTLRLRASVPSSASSQHIPPLLQAFYERRRAA